MRALLLLLFLTGCGSGGDNSNNNHGYGFAYDVQGASGLKLRYSPVVAAGDPMADPVFYENAQTEVETCSGLRAKAPFVILVADLGQVGGLYWPNPSLIVIPSTAVGDFRLIAVKHEMIHYLLDVNTGDPDTNHHSHLFVDCT